MEKSVAVSKKKQKYNDHMIQQFHSWVYIRRKKKTTNSRRCMYININTSIIYNCQDMEAIYSPLDSPGQNTGMSSLLLLQGIFPTQGSNPGLLHREQILYQLSHQGSPRILEWVAYPISSGASQPRNQTGVSCFAGRFFTK